jgi:hypothetical protein
MLTTPIFVAMSENAELTVYIKASAYLLITFPLSSAANVPLSY